MLRLQLTPQEECRYIVNSLCNYGEGFPLFQQKNVRTRSVDELVQFYYQWKKTARHDLFANRARLGKRKYTLRPGITVVMDRFLEKQESESVTHKDKSSPPNIYCLI
jgi:hypothetical protein